MKEISTLLRDLKMSTTEVAELTGKQAKHINRDAAVMLEKLGQSGFDVSGAVVERDARGYIKNIQLNRNLAFTLISGYDVVLRHKVSTRWIEMEEAVATKGSFAADRWYNVETVVDLFYERTKVRRKPVSSAARDRLFNLRNSEQIAWVGGNPTELEPNQFYVREDAYLLTLAILFDDITRFHTDWISNRDYILSRQPVYELDKIKGVHRNPVLAAEPLSEEEQWRRLIEED